MTWQQLSEDNLRAAVLLLREGHHRSSVSRAYYAAYCAATNEIIKMPTTFSYGRNNPTHEKVPMYIERNLKISQTKKDTINTLFNTLRHFREDADYRPHVPVDDQSARDYIRDAGTIQQELWGEPWTI